MIEARAPRRHPVVVLTLLAAAGLMRPEAWVLAGLYWLWLVPRLSWRQRALFAALAAVAPLVWAGVDLAVTGDWKYSLTATGDLAEELGRNKGGAAVPAALYAFLVKLAKFPVVIASCFGLALAIALTPRRALMPLLLFLAGAGTFALVGVAGLSVIDRYLLVPSLCVMIFAAVFIAGWTMLDPGTAWRRLWMAGAAAVVVFGIAFTATRVNLVSLRNELQFRGDAHVALERVLRDPAVVRALRCGPVYVPNHKLIPDVRWILERPSSDVDRALEPAPQGRAWAGRGHERRRDPRAPPPGALQAGVRDRQRRKRRQHPAGWIRSRRDEPVLRRLCQLLSASSAMATRMRHATSA